MGDLACCNGVWVGLWRDSIAPIDSFLSVHGSSNCRRHNTILNAERFADFANRHKRQASWMAGVARYRYLVVDRMILQCFSVLAAGIGTKAVSNSVVRG